MLSKLSYLAGVGCWPGGEGAGKNDGTIEKKNKGQGEDLLHDKVEG